MNLLRCNTSNSHFNINPNNNHLKENTQPNIPETLFPRPPKSRRIFGKNLANITNLTENDHAPKNPSGFFQAYDIIKANQANQHLKPKPFNRNNSINNLPINASLLETEKQVDIITSIPPIIRPILSKGTISYHENRMIIDKEQTDISKAPQPNPQYVTEYQEDILAYYKELDLGYAMNNTYMTKQTDINGKMREILIDWLVEVHAKFKLCHETLFITISLIDRYLSMTVIDRKRLQLVGVTALFIASKYEEIYPPELKHYVYITDNAYEKKDVIAMESDMLSKIKFDISISTPLRQLEMVGLYYKLSEKEANMGKYLLELALIKYNMIKYSPSVLAIGAVYLSGKLLNRSEGISVENMVSYNCVNRQMISDCCKDLWELVKGKQNNKGRKSTGLSAVNAKYSSKKYMEVAQMTFDNSTIVELLN